MMAEPLKGRPAGQKANYFPPVDDKMKKHLTIVIKLGTFLTDHDNVTSNLKADNHRDVLNS